MKSLNFTMIIPRIKPKYNKAAIGNYIIRNNQMYFQSGKDIVYIREHFPAAGAAAETLIENTIRYDSENFVSETVENQNNVCYNIEVNDVL